MGAVGPQSDTRETLDWRECGNLLFLFVVAVALWNTGALFPLRTLVVFFHEISHGLAALITGGSIVKMQVTLGEGGQCVTRGGWTIIILSAGYIGSMVWGGLLLQLASRPKLSTAALWALAGVLGIVTVSWVRPIWGGGFLFGLVAAALFVACAVWLPDRLHTLIVRTIGLTSCMYALLDVVALFRGNPGNVSDATLLAEATWIPAWVWASFWLVVSVGVAWRLVGLACRRRPP